MAGTRRALVLGASGKVGKPLCRALREDGWDVIGAARFSRPDAEAELGGIGVRTIRFDVMKDDPADLPDVEALFLEIWDPGQPDLIWPINFYGVGRVAERYAGVANMVNGCTINVYGDGPTPSTEATPCRPSSEYGRSRYAQERLIDYFCLRSGSRGIHVRYAHANSATQGVVRRMAESIASAQSLGADPDANMQVIALEDFVRVTHAALDRAACPPVWVNCCHPRLWTRRELAGAIRDALGRGEVIFDREHGGLESSACADTARMVEWFGEPTVSVDTLIRRVAEDMNRG